MAYIDDASSRVFARFYEYEGTIPAMDSFQRYVRRYGLPLAVYADKHTTYRSPAEPPVAEQLTGTKPQSQFGRALRELGVELIAAHSPQAKGRVERLFRTFQDRLIKELRLAGLATIEDANRFVESYLLIYNRRFAVPPAQAAELHRPRPTVQILVRSLCSKTSRCRRKDFTIAHEGRLYQVHDNLRTMQVVVEEHMDGTMRLTHQGRSLGFHAIPARPVPAAAVTTMSRSRRPITPTADHPWRTRWRPERGHHPAAAGTYTGPCYLGSKRTFLFGLDRTKRSHCKTASTTVSSAHPSGMYSSSAR